MRINWKNVLTFRALVAYPYRRWNDLRRQFARRSHAEEALRETERRLRTALDGLYEAPVGLCFLDLELRYLFINRWLAKLNGSSVEEHLGRTIREVLPEVAAGAESQLRHVLETGEPIIDGFVDAGTPADPGRKRVFQHNYYPVVGDDGTVAGVSCAVQDVTQRKRAEVALREAHDGLERRVKERTAELTNANQTLRTEITERKLAEEAKEHLAEQLHQSQKMEAVGTLAAGLAHSFCNMTAAILGYVEIAEKEVAGDSPVGTTLREIKNIAHQSNGITRSLLTFSRGAEKERKVLCLSDLVLDTLRWIEGMLPSRIKIGADVPPDRDVWINGDASQLQQVLVNLATNSRDAISGEGSVQISVSHRPPGPLGQDQVVKEGESGVAVIVVEDNGGGMSEEVRVRIFEPFYTTKDREQGTGLGMSVIHGIVRDHGGSINVASAVGKGTVVTVELPCCAAPPEETAIESAMEASTGGRGTILLVEPSEQLSAVIAAALSSAGHRVLQAGNSSEVMQRLEEHHSELDLLIADIQSASKAASASLANLLCARDALPLILLGDHTGNKPGDIVATDTTVLRKPLEMKQLLSAVDRILTRSRADEITT